MSEKQFKVGDEVWHVRTWGAVEPMRVAKPRRKDGIYPCVNKDRGSRPWHRHENELFATKVDALLELARREQAKADEHAISAAKFRALAAKESSVKP